MARPCQVRGASALSGPVHGDKCNRMHARTTRNCAPRRARVVDAGSLRARPLCAAAAF